MVRLNFQDISTFLVGVTIGYLTVGSLMKSLNEASGRGEVAANGTLLIAIVTADKFLQQRTETINMTWAQTALEMGVQVLFFTGEVSSQSSVGDFPIIRLPGVDDTYPPQKKVFKMLQYLQRYHMQHYKWLLRADDDLYVRVKELVSFLNTLDHHQKLYMGQPGLGKPDDLERLKLYSYEHFCMGGPGVIFSSSLLSSLVEHLDYCLQNVVSYNEDVEIGRCISRQLNIQCTWAYDVRNVPSYVKLYNLYADVYTCLRKTL